MALKRGPRRIFGDVVPAVVVNKLHPVICVECYYVVYGGGSYCELKGPEIATKSPCLTDSKLVSPEYKSVALPLS
jgi:hypothetical protein